ncbi:hypothetical protein SAR11G3_01443 [Candidatus Pelagibacter sp. IMCC9063]|uniref:ubiquinone biosynthesis protein COQ9 n=1 Tax=Pelagibacter sp. (strain IMCC9063) TaxID=1002672 RepID=UPI00020465F7|nr:DUF2961 domain-containing protein [Candidatus Pelagibacter sp. IMCC9063]AEA81918.1 hypothetical protein SAR11G3_01443 [Candidatus Pelagibacter sp. IMCC9063]
MTNLEKKKLLNFLLMQKSSFSFSRLKELELVKKNKNYRYLDSKEIAFIVLSFYFEENLKQLDLLIPKTKSTTAKIKQFLQYQLESDLKNKNFLKKSFLFLLTEKKVSQILDYFFSTSSKMWSLAGDTATDINYYSKRLILSSIYSKIFIKMLNLSNYSKELIEEDIQNSLKKVKQFNDLKSKICSADILSIIKNFNFGSKEKGRGF